MDTDLASKILSALILEQDTTQDSQKESISIDDQKRYLTRWIDSVSIEDRKSIGNLLVMNNKRDALRPCSEGTVINLDTLPVDIIRQMYNLMLYKREKKV